MGALAQPGDFKGTAAKPKILSAEAPCWVASCWEARRRVRRRITFGVELDETFTALQALNLNCEVGPGLKRRAEDLK